MGMMGPAMKRMTKLGIFYSRQTKKNSKDGINHIIKVSIMFMMFHLRQNFDEQIL